jgi:hypothetical protein
VPGPLKGGQQAGEVLTRESVSRSQLLSAARHQMAEHSRHRVTLVNEDPHIALWCTKGERLGERGECALVVADGFPAERLPALAWGMLVDRFRPDRLTWWALRCDWPTWP